MRNCHCLILMSFVITGRCRCWTYSRYAFGTSKLRFLITHPLRFSTPLHAPSLFSFLFVWFWDICDLIWIRSSCSRWDSPRHRHQPHRSRWNWGGWPSETLHPPPEFCQGVGSGLPATVHQGNSMLDWGKNLGGLTQSIYNSNIKFDFIRSRGLSRSTWIELCNFWMKFFIRCQLTDVPWIKSTTTTDTLDLFLTIWTFAVSLSLGVFLWDFYYCDNCIVSFKFNFWFFV